MEVITIQEDIQIPGTDFVLEKGDKIVVKESRFFLASFSDKAIVEIIHDIVTKVAPSKSSIPIKFIENVDTYGGEDYELWSSGIGKVEVYKEGDVMKTTDIEQIFLGNVENGIDPDGIRSLKSLLQTVTQQRRGRPSSNRSGWED